MTYRERKNYCVYVTTAFFDWDCPLFTIGNSTDRVSK